MVEPYPSEKYDFVSWDDDIPNIWKVIKFHGSSHHQPEMVRHISEVLFFTLISEVFKDLIIFNPSIAINIIVKCHDMCRLVGL